MSRGQMPVAGYSCIIPTLSERLQLKLTCECLVFFRGFPGLVAFLPGIVAGAKHAY